MLQVPNTLEEVAGTVGVGVGELRCGLPTPHPNSRNVCSLHAYCDRGCGLIVS
jgi:hypothetical protein